VALVGQAFVEILIPRARKVSGSAAKGRLSGSQAYRCGAESAYDTNRCLFPYNHKSERAVQATESARYEKLNALGLA
jgi:hypothetical protein